MGKRWSQDGRWIGRDEEAAVDGLSGDVDYGRPIGAVHGRDAHATVDVVKLSGVLIGLQKSGTGGGNFKTCRVGRVLRALCGGGKKE